MVTQVYLAVDSDHVANVLQHGYRLDKRRVVPCAETDQAARDGFNHNYPDRVCQVLLVEVARLAEHACELLGRTAISVPDRLLPADCLVQQLTALVTTAQARVERPMPCLMRVERTDGHRSTTLRRVATVERSAEAFIATMESVKNGAAAAPTPPEL